MLLPVGATGRAGGTDAAGTNTCTEQAAYQENTAESGQAKFILLLHKGKELPDEKTLGELGITDGDVLVHIEVRRGYQSVQAGGDARTDRDACVCTACAPAVPPAELQAARRVDQDAPKARGGEPQDAQAG